VIRVTVELIPSEEGEGSRQLLSEMCIATTGVGVAENTRNYQAVSYILKPDGRTQVVGKKVKNFTNEQSVLELVREVLNSRDENLRDIAKANELLARTKLMVGVG
jgi:hypothetical protein